MRDLGEKRSPLGSLGMRMVNAGSAFLVMGGMSLKEFLLIRIVTSKRFWIPDSQHKQKWMSITSHTCLIGTGALFVSRPRARIWTTVLQWIERGDCLSIHGITVSRETRRDRRWQFWWARRGAQAWLWRTHLWRQVPKKKKHIDNLALNQWSQLATAA